MDFWISRWISGFQIGFLDFVWISRFLVGFLDFALDFGFLVGFLPTVYEISGVSDPSVFLLVCLLAGASDLVPTALSFAVASF